MMKVFAYPFWIMIHALVLTSDFAVAQESGFSQESNFEFYDSLYSHYQNHSNADYRDLVPYLWHNDTTPDTELPRFWKLVLNRTEGVENYQATHAMALFYLSIDQTIAGDASKAMDMAKQALEIFESLNMHNESSEAYNTIGGMLASNGDIGSGIKSLKKAIVVADRDKDHALYAYTRIVHRLVLGYVFGRGELLDSAVFYTSQALKLTKNGNFESAKANCYNNLGSYHMKLKEPELALTYLNKALEACQSSLTDHIRPHILSKLAIISSENRDLTTAMNYVEEGLNICRSYHTFLPQWLKLLRQKQSILATTGNFEEALKVANRCIHLRDSSITMEKVRREKFLQEEFKANQREQKIASLSQQATIQSLQLLQQRFLTLGLIALILLIGAGGSLFYRQKKLKQERRLANLEMAEAKKRLEVEKQYRDSELKALRSQMNPHFVFNALNSIQEYIATNEKKLAGKYLGKFANLMRMYLKHSQSQTISVQEEINALEIYLELEKIRFSDTLDYHIDTSKVNGADLLEIPPLLIQPFVENALKHGLLHKKDDRKLQVTFTSMEDQLVVTIEDNGVGRKRSAEIHQLRNKNHESFASSATQKRLNLLNKDRVKPITGHVSDKIDKNGHGIGTTVTVSIPTIKPL